MNREYFRFVTLIFYTLLLVELIQGQCLNSSLSWTFVQRDVTQISGPTWTQSNTLRISGQGEGRDFGFGSNGDTFLLNYFVKFLFLTFRPIQQEMDTLYQEFPTLIPLRIQVLLDPWFMLLPFQTQDFTELFIFQLPHKRMDLLWKEMLLDL